MGGDSSDSSSTAGPPAASGLILWIGPHLTGLCNSPPASGLGLSHQGGFLLLKTNKDLRHRAGVLAGEEQQHKHPRVAVTPESSCCWWGPASRLEAPESCRWGEKPRAPQDPGVSLLPTKPEYEYRNPPSTPPRPFCEFTALETKLCPGLFWGRRISVLLCHEIATTQSRNPPSPKINSKAPPFLPS